MSETHQAPQQSRRFWMGIASLVVVLLGLLIVLMMQGFGATGQATREPAIAFIKRAADDMNGELWLTNLDGTEQTRLSLPAQDVRDFDVAPEGDMIVYSVNAGATSEPLWRVPLRSPAGEPEMLVGSDGVLYRSPRWSPRGDLLAVETSRETRIGDQQITFGAPSVQVLQASDGALVDEGVRRAQTPRWSSDGNLLAYIEATTGAPGIYEIGGRAHQFEDEGALLGEQPWAPEGLMFVYTRVEQEGESSHQVVVTRHIDMGWVSILTSPPTIASTPAWSPDGTLVAFSVALPAATAAETELWLMTPDGSDGRSLVAEPGVTHSQPLWSPAGDWLLFGRFQRAMGRLNQSIWIVRADGTEMRQVAEEGLRPRWIP
jgi:Tol biopolymer transport system component